MSNLFQSSRINGSLFAHKANDIEIFLLKYAQRPPFSHQTHNLLIIKNFKKQQKTIASL